MTTSLVSIAIVTYNSADTIEETLNSISAQSYPTLEIIISDDGSTDNTIAICQKWLRKNFKRFSSSKLLTVTKNTGVSANLNRAEFETLGRWVKVLAGDDLLLPNAIHNYVQHMLLHPDITYLFANTTAFGNNSERINAFHNAMIEERSFFDATPREQYVRLMTHRFCIPTPSFFYDREKNNKLGINNDESITLLEYLPKWIQITHAGEKLHFLDTTTSQYRIRDNSISNGTNNHKTQFIIAKCQVWTKYQFGYYFKIQPRLACIKYIKMKQYCTGKKIWYRLEHIGQRIDVLYRKIRRTSINDWDGNYIY